MLIIYHTLVKNARRTFELQGNCFDTEAIPSFYAVLAQRKSSRLVSGRSQVRILLAAPMAETPPCQQDMVRHTENRKS